ncbi:MAG: 3'-5' exonuclease [Chitinophagales bacterium]
MYLFFDTETTGLPRDWKAPVTNVNNWPRLVQLAWALYDNEGNMVAQDDQIIKPIGFRIPIGASNVHGITTERAMAEGEELISVLSNFEQKIHQSTYLVAHNMSFDEKIMGAEFLRNGFRNVIPSKNQICTMKASTDFCRIAGPYGYKWPKLEELYFKLFAESFSDAHNAAADIAATSRCFWELKRLGVL